MVPSSLKVLRHLVSSPCRTLARTEPYAEVIPGSRIPNYDNMYLAITMSVLTKDGQGTRI
ncbi:hypothetical protein DPMN_120889 [Dreissena polymorpha]|uniref:Uncharacterized protein n=1 Tax=Dreissena polymorpha TaxID=45954 RepID=A0A9D4JP01_DREPO|nr:hypothetical protein DPMN_120889 [Dreissena polymorpha]